MKTIDDMIVKSDGVAPGADTPRKPPHYRERYRSKADQDRVHLNQMISNTISRINTEPEAFKQYLDIQSRFPTFTVKNAILVMAQNADATYLADAETWKDKGFTIHRGETGVQIFGPGISDSEANDDTKSSVSIRTLYDVHQTTALPTPEPTIHYDQRLLLKAILRTSPCKVDSSTSVTVTRKALYNLQNDTILIHPGVTPVSLFHTLAEQISMRIAMSNRLQEPQRIQLSNAVCYMLCKKYGVELPKNGIDVIPDWFAALGENQVIQELSNACDVAKQMREQMDETLKLRKAIQLPERGTAGKGGG